MPVCCCDLTAPIEVRTKLAVLVHRVEAFKTTNTGRLAALALGARFDRWGEPDGSHPALPQGPLLLLFPSESSRPLLASDAEHDATLVVPDGNWPQARKIAKRVQAEAPERVTCVRIVHESASGYLLRHTTREGAVSTIESIAYALGVLEGPELEGRVLAMFRAFVARHSAFSGVASRPRTG
jgi:DTW domain-containing protein YfiP